MARYEYKVVPFIGSLKTKQGADIVAQQLSGIVNQYAEASWEFYQLGNVKHSDQPWLLCSFFRSKRLIYSL